MVKLNATADSSTPTFWHSMHVEVNIELRCLSIDKHYFMTQKMELVVTYGMLPAFATFLRLVTVFKIV